jgi:hypothetical protein
LREDLRGSSDGSKVDAALVRALSAIRDLDIPHLEPEEDLEDQVVH